MSSRRKGQTSCLGIKSSGFLFNWITTFQRATETVKTLDTSAAGKHLVAPKTNGVVYENVD